MSEIKRPLKKSLLYGCSLFVLTLCFFLTGTQYFTLKRSFYGLYEKRISSILDLAEGAIDADDLAECIRTGQESDKYCEAQAFLDLLMEKTGLHHLYVVIPLNAGPTDNMKNVIAGASGGEHEHPAERHVLNQLSGDTYSPDAASKYLAGYREDGDTFFENRTAVGNDYTGMRVLRTSDGDRVAALCADFEAGEIANQLKGNMLDILVVILILGLLFATAFLMWADSNLIRPIRLLEKGVSEYAGKSRDMRCPDNMVLSLPEIRTRNEVGSLARASEKMSLDIRNYMTELLKKEKELARLSTMANRDPLTKAGNRKAFDSYAEGIQLKMSEEVLEYAVLVMNTNGLRQINDRYGHEKGDLYLLKSCRIICDIFRQSSVFRVDGDEFAAILTGEDYRMRVQLLKQARKEIAASSADESAAPWERVSAAIGMADYNRKNDRTVQSVLDRAALQMDEEKKRIRNEGSGT